MTWHTETVPEHALRDSLERIRCTGGTVTHCRTCSSGYCVTYVTVDDRIECPHAPA